jgi:hypothetical protein
MSQQTRTRLLTAGVLLTVFGTGVVLGYAADSTLKPTPAAALVAGDEVDGEDDGVDERVPMYEQVGPDSAQSVVIDSIVREHRARIDLLNRQFQEEYDPQLRQIVEETRAAIRDVFSPEQAAQYQALTDERDRRRAEEEAGGGEDEEEEQDQ